MEEYGPTHQQPEISEEPEEARDLQDELGEDDMTLRIGTELTPFTRKPLRMTFWRYPETLWVITREYLRKL